MAYTKTTWNNLSNPPINADNLNKIEQGIYDNSLGIDKINPSGTATTTAEIEAVQINDVIGFKSLKLKGQTSQYTTTGKNLLAIKQLTTQTINGVTFTPHYTGNKLDYVNVNGTATATAGYFLDNASIDQASTYTNELPSGTYILDDFSGSSSVNTAIFFRYSTDNSTLTTINSVENSRKITIDSTFKFASYIRIANGATVNNMKFYPQLETGSTQTTYEPYTNGASPNPDYPQDVNNVSGDNVVEISNKNIISVDDFTTTAYGITITKNGNIWEINGTATANNTFKFIPNIQKKLSGGYALSSKYISGTKSGTANFNLRDNTSDSALFNVNLTTSNTSNTSTLNNVIKYAIYIANGATFSNYKFSPQLEKGSTATSYTAHQGNEFEVDLPVENLLNLTDGTYTNNGVTAIVNNNEIILNGTATTSTSFIEIPYEKTLPTNTTYTMSINNDFTNSDSGNGIRLASNDSTKVTFQTLNNNKTFSFVNALAYDKLVIRNVVGTSFKNAKVKVMLNLGSIAHAFTPYGTNPIELCKISTYQDYIFKKDGKWYKHKIIQKTIFDGTEEWRKSGNTSVDRFWLKLYNGSVPSFHNMFSNKFNYQYNVSSLNVAWIDVYETEERLFVNYTAYGTTTLEQFQEWLATAKPIFYYPLAKPIEEEITYTPLIRQLDELYNSGLYDVTNISQDNSSEAFILDLEACKNNINGIVEYIRR